MKKHVVAVLLFAWFIPLAPGDAAEPKPRPNFVVVFIDDKC